MKGGDGLILIVVIIAVIGMVIAALISVGWILLGGIAVFGAVAGIYVGLKNFIEVLDEAHKSMPFSFKVEFQEYVLRIFKEQPANLTYPFGGGWQVMRYVRENVFLRTEPEAKQFFRKGETFKLNAEIASGILSKYYNWCIYAGCMLAGVMQYVAAFMIVAFFYVFEFLFLIIWMLLSALAIGLLAAFNFLFSFIYRIFVRCPDCHEQMLVPVYICSNSSCGEKHTRLWPSVYGVFYHSCKCGERLPAVDWLGRTRLARSCAVCNHPMNEEIGRQINIHIPVIGGPNSGKSNFIFQATREFIDGYAEPRKIKVSFPDKNHLANYEANTRMLASGKELIKTPDIIPQAYNITVKRPMDWIGKIIYLYDAAGEAYSADSNTIQQKPYFDYIHGLIFVIDPFSLETFARSRQSEIREIKGQIRPSTLGVMEAYSRMLTVLEASFGVKKGDKFRHPIAIVVTKTDALDLENLIGRPAARELMVKNPSIRLEEDAIDILVEKFLEENQMGNFIRDLRMQFLNIRFFSCSSLGRLPDPDNTTGYSSIGVLEPLLWILSEVNVLNIARERAKKMDSMNKKDIEKRSNIFQKAKYYFWDSLNPGQK